MTHTTCDFCGEEMRSKDRVATLTVRDRGQNDDESPYAMFPMFGGGRSRSGNELEMCADCLGHLLPITERIRREKLAAKVKYPKAPTPIMHQEFNTLMTQMMESMMKRPRKSEDDK